MGLKDKIRSDLKASMKNQDKISLSVLRLLNSDIRNKEIELIKEIGDDDVVKIIKSNVKKRKDSVEMYKQGKREDLVKQEESEIVILQKYLPEEMGEEAIRTIVKNVISKTGLGKSSDFGGLMKEVMKETGGNADGKTVSSIVRDELGKIQ
ncbi:MAG: GatB/YqeY domain-containing protein [Candidatus Paceibacterota bacterium]|jgi:hypothetical protein